MTPVEVLVEEAKKQTAHQAAIRSHLALIAGVVVIAAIITSISLFLAIAQRLNAH